MAEGQLSEADLLEPALARYEADGFDVFVQPSASILPDFMAGYRPDAIAVRPDRKIAIEFKRSGAAETLSESLGQLFAAHPEWELVILYISPRSANAPIRAPDPEAIRTSIEQVRRLKEAGSYAAALLMGWSTLEAIARSALPGRLGRPQPPTKLVEHLAAEGIVTPREADTLRKFAAIRNAAAHGSLGASVTSKQLDRLLALLSSLSSQTIDP